MKGVNSNESEDLAILSGIQIKVDVYFVKNQSYLIDKSFLWIMEVGEPFTAFIDSEKERGGILSISI